MRNLNLIFIPSDQSSGIRAAPRQSRYKL